MCGEEGETHKIEPSPQVSLSLSLSLSLGFGGCPRSRAARPLARIASAAVKTSSEKKEKTDAGKAGSSASRLLRASSTASVESLAGLRRRLASAAPTASSTMPAKPLALAVDILAATRRTGTGVARSIHCLRKRTLPVTTQKLNAASLTSRFETRERERETSLGSVWLARAARHNISTLPTVGAQRLDAAPLARDERRAHPLAQGGRVARLRSGKRERALQDRASRVVRALATLVDRSRDSLESSIALESVRAPRTSLDFFFFFSFLCVSCSSAMGELDGASSASPAAAHCAVWLPTMCRSVGGHANARQLAP